MPVGATRKNPRSHAESGGFLLPRRGDRIGARRALRLQLIPRLLDAPQWRTGSVALTFRHDEAQPELEERMGQLIYGSTTYALDDRVLAHLQVVVSMKLRRGENFFVSWRSSTADGSGRQSVWI